MNCAYNERLHVGPEWNLSIFYLALTLACTPEGVRLLHFACSAIQKSTEYATPIYWASYAKNVALCSEGWMKIQETRYNRLKTNSLDVLRWCWAHSPFRMYQTWMCLHFALLSWGKGLNYSTVIWFEMGPESTKNYNLCSDVTDDDDG